MPFAQQKCWLVELKSWENSKAKTILKVDQSSHFICGPKIICMKINAIVTFVRE